SILLMNTSALELFGIDPEKKLPGMSFPSLMPSPLLDPDSGAPIAVEEHPLRKAAKGVITTGYETGIMDRTGSVRYILINASPIVNKNGESIAAIMVCTDISEKRRIEDAMNRVNRKLNMLTSITRNEIQNQGFVLLGYLEICKSIATEPEVITFLDKIQERVNQLNAHISNTRNFQDMGVNPPKWQNLREVYIFAASHVKLSEVNHVQEIGSYEVFADLFFEKALTNILNNAITHGGNVSMITAFTEERGLDLVLIITDDGCGIDSERKEQIFLHGYPSNQGFGLFFAREVLSITGLMIAETGEAGSGARFEITIPKGKFRIIRESEDSAGN
ncbi:MAG: PAS domain-containing protein, partial [Methanospirillum sp.]|nr:PAS domain-containing protein [Methanospirillum sp.]